jgi:hypothetical protein
MVDRLQGFNQRSMGSGMMQIPLPLTGEQKEQVKSILSHYDSSNLSSDDARAIFQSFRESGIRPALGLKETIAEAGFNAEQLRTLARTENNASSLIENSNLSSNGIKMASLKSLISILSQYDLENMSAEEQKELYTQLNEEGLLKPGSQIDLST